MKSDIEKVVNENTNQIKGLTKSQGSLVALLRKTVTLHEQNLNLIGRIVNILKLMLLAVALLAALIILPSVVLFVTKLWLEASPDARLTTIVAIGLFIAGYFVRDFFGNKGEKKAKNN